MKAIWFTGGFVSLGLGIIGIVLPVLPTTPFILLAAFCFAKSSENFHTMLVEHKVFGPLIKDWDENGAINPKAKILAVSMMALVFSASLYLELPIYALAVQALCLISAGAYVLTRPSGPDKS